MQRPTLLPHCTLALAWEQAWARVLARVLAPEALAWAAASAAAWAAALGLAWAARAASEEAWSWGRALPLCCRQSCPALQ
jgi:hypothetical protein